MAGEVRPLGRRERPGGDRADAWGEEIARRIRRGDRAAFDELFDRCAGRLLGFLMGMVGDRATAEDLVQETMLRVYRHIGRYRERGSFRAWIFRIAGNLALTELRRRRYRAAQPLDAAILEIPDERAADPEEARAAAEREWALHAALSALADGQRAVILLRVREGMPIHEIARTLCVPEGTVKSRIHLAVRKLQELVSRRERREEDEERHEALR